MSESLFKNLKDIGIDEELAHQVSASLNPDHVASKQDVLVLQEAILQQQVRSDEQFNRLMGKIGEQKVESDRKYHELQVESDKRYYEQQAESDKRYHKQQAESDKRYHKQQAESDKRYHEQKAESDKRYFELKSEMAQGFADIRSEMHTMNRQFIFAFGGMIVTILSVLAINIYYH